MSAGTPRVLFICPQPFFAWRGSPLRVANDVAALASLGYAVDLLTLPLGEARDIPGVRILRVARIPGLRKIAIGPSPGKMLYDILLFFRGLREILRQPYDVVHGVEEAGLIACVLGRLSGAAVVYEKHSDPVSHRASRLKNIVLALYARVERLMISGADAVVATCQTLAAQVRTLNPRKTVFHIFDLPSSSREAEPDRVRELRARLAARPDELLALYVGSFAVYQGIDLMFEALQRVLERRPNLRLVVIGGTDAERKLRLRWLAERGIAERVTFVGFVPPDALPDYLGAADLLLSPRVSGINSPLKLLDYLKARRPIVATDLAANRELVDETCAVLVPPEPEALAAGVERLCDSPALRTQLAAAGRRRIDELYNMDGFNQRLRACYSALPRRD